ncbi:MAG: archaeosortase/exosortase family protein [Acidobacteria bacterium]|nr:archaeosortase/exosortase family protein [Acidobacteriota bacterium]
MFGALCLCLLLAHLNVLRALAELSGKDPSASHLVLIPVITLALIYRRRVSIFSTVRFAWGAGSGVILVGLLCFLGAFLSRPSVGPHGMLMLQVTTLVILWTGGFLLFYGLAAFRAALFPLLFLGFMIPIPGVLLDAVTRILIIGSSETVAGLFALTGTPYHREGFLFALPGLTIAIADECSGIRSTIALLLTGLLAGHMYLRSGWSKAVLFAAILPLTILKNGIRIVSLSLLSIHVDPSFLSGRLHHDGGVVFFLLALALLLPLLIVLRRTGVGHRFGERPPSPSV